MHDVNIFDPSLAEIIQVANHHAIGRRTRTAIPSLSISRSEAGTPKEAAMCRPSILFVLQGEKTVLIGDFVLRYRPATYFVYPVDLPAVSEIVAASGTCPYLAVALTLDFSSIASLLDDVTSPPISDPFATTPMGKDVFDALRRMIQLLDRPGDISVLGPMLEREIFFRLLQGPQGAMLRQLAIPDSRLSNVRRSINWLRAHYQQSVHIEQLAELAGMSRAAFHRHFKSATALSPIQYQKQIRLLHARQMLIGNPANIANVAYAIGYESPSQFSREYARQFGYPPTLEKAHRVEGNATNINLTFP